MNTKVSLQQQTASSFTSIVKAQITLLLTHLSPENYTATTLEISNVSTFIEGGNYEGKGWEGRLGIEKEGSKTRWL
jgi:hypothetical protein